MRRWILETETIWVATKTSEECRWAQTKESHKFRCYNSTSSHSHKYQDKVRGRGDRGYLLNRF